MALTLQIEIEGSSEEDIEMQLDDIAGKIKQGYTSGILLGGHWDLTGEEDEMEDGEGN